MCVPVFLRTLHKFQMNFNAKSAGKTIATDEAAALSTL